MAAATIGAVDETPTARLDIEHTDSPAGLALAGDIDSHTAPALAEALAGAAADSDLVVDVAAVGFIDSSGLRVLVEENKRFEAAGSVLSLANASEAVRRLVEITGLTDTINLRG